MENPVATQEQHEHELAALELVEHPVVREAYERVAKHWLEKAAPSEQTRRRANSAAGSLSSAGRSANASSGARVSVTSKASSARSLSRSPPASESWPG